VLRYPERASSQTPAILPQVNALGKWDLRLVPQDPSRFINLEENRFRLRHQSNAVRNSETVSSCG
jgi:hypothetical protein